MLASTSAKIMKGDQRSIMDSTAYRNAMARLGAAVNIITSDGGAGCVGLTASAVCSVTDSPPTLLVCLNQGVSAHDAIIENEVLCVNTLSSAHEELSRRFSGGIPMNDRFSGTNWQILKTGSPVLGDALVSFDCRIVKATRYSTHSVLFCEVIATGGDEMNRSGLMYFARKYHIVGHES
jgi:flavin reductase